MAVGGAASTIFVTGTDTGTGKTLAACALLHRARAEGLCARGYKPVASGSTMTPRGLRNADALALLAAAGEPVECDASVYAGINPYCFEPPIAPHLAAREAGVNIDPNKLDAGHALRATDADWVVVEGAGGWRVPLMENFGFCDWVVSQRWPVVLVVGLRLGCINHALLSAEVIARQCRLLGWIANRLPPPMSRVEENIDTLRALMPVPCVAEFGVNATVPQAAAALNWVRIRG